MDTASFKSVREIGDEAVWSLSSAKPGNGVEQLRDDNMDTYWQSDGLQPHLINLYFSRKISVAEVGLYLDFKLDESYTPRHIILRSGTTSHDLQLLHEWEIEEPSGWIYFPVGYHHPYKQQRRKRQRRKRRRGAGGGGNIDDEDEDEDNNNNKNNNTSQCIKTHFLQVEIASMHQNGRDTHVRQVKVWGPRSSTDGLMRGARSEMGDRLQFVTQEFVQFSSIR